MNPTQRKRAEKVKVDELTRRLQWGHLMIGAVGFIGGMAVNAWTIASNIATKPYVDAGIESSRKYTDQKAAQTLKDAFEHSDDSLQAFRLKFESDTAELKSDVKAIGTKQDMMLDMFRAMENRQISDPRRAR